MGGDVQSQAETETQKPQSEESPAFHHHKSESFFRPRPFSIQPQADTEASQEQEIPAYSRVDRDAIWAKLLKSMGGNVQSQAEAESQKPESEPEETADEMSNEAVSLQRLSESGESGDEDDNSPNGGTIQRVCDKCESQLHGERIEQEKSDAELSHLGGAIHRKEESSESEDDKMNPVQTKLTIGAPGDKYEQEADQMAERVMSMDASANPQAVQRQSESEEDFIQKQPLAVSITPLIQQFSESAVQTKPSVQRAEENAASSATPSLENRLASEKGSGSPLDNQTRSFMESRFGNDFSGVRVHTDSSSVSMNKELGAQAFTHGNDIYFNSGKYNPGSSEGKKLLAHELTHTIQQTGAVQPKALTKLTTKENKLQAKECSAVSWDALPAIQLKENPQQQTGEESKEPSTQPVVAAAPTTESGQQGAQHQAPITGGGDAATAPILAPKVENGGSGAAAIQGNNIPVAPGAAGSAAGGSGAKSPVSTQQKPDIQSLGTQSLGEAAPQQDSPAINSAAQPQSGFGNIGGFSNPSVSDAFAAAAPPTAEADGNQSGVGIDALLPIVDEVFNQFIGSSNAEFDQKVADIESLAQDTLAKIESAAQTLIGQLTSAFAEGRTAVTEAFTQSRTEVEQSKTGAKEKLTQSVNTAHQQVDTNKEVSATQVNTAIEQATSQLQSQVETVRTETNATNDQSNLQSRAQAVKSRYAGKDSQAEVSSAVDDVASRSASELQNQTGTATTNLNGVDSQAAQRWQTEGQTAHQHIEAAVQSAKTAIEQGKSEAEQGIETKVGEQLASFDTAEAESLSKLDTQETEQVAEAEAKADVARQGLEQNKASQRQELEKGRNQTTTSSENARAEVVALLQENPDASADPVAFRAALENTTGGQLESLKATLDGSHSQVQGGWQQEADNFTSQSAAAGSDAATKVNEGANTTRVTLKGQVTHIEGGLDNVATNTGQKIVGVGEQSATAMGQTVQQMQGGLQQGRSNVIGSLNEGQAAFQTSKDRGVSQASNSMEQAAQEADKSWWEEALSAIGSFLSGLWDGLVSVFKFIGDALLWVGKQLVNLVWGFIWGEPVFTDVWGAQVVAFIGDFIAGVLVYGDIRDILKWGFIKPVLFGEGYSAENWLMIGIAAFGLIPLIGDTGKLVKGIKALLKGGAKQIAKELAEKLGKELAERLIKELGEEAAERLLKELGDKLLKELVEQLGERTLKELVGEFGEAGIKQLAETLGVKGLKGLIEKFTVNGLKELIDKFTLNGLKELIDKFTLNGLKELVDKFTVNGLKELIDTFTLKGLKDLVDEVSINGLKELVDAFTIAGLKELTETFTMATIKELVTAFGAKGLKQAWDAVGKATFSDLVSEFGAAALKTAWDEIGEQGIKVLTKDLAASAIKKLYADLSGLALKNLTDGLSGNQIFDLVHNHGLDTNYLKSLAEVAGSGRSLARAIVHFGSAGDLARVLTKAHTSTMSAAVLKEFLDACYTTGFRKIEEIEKFFGFVIQHGVLSDAIWRDVIHWGRNFASESVGNLTSYGGRTVADASAPVQRVLQLADGSTVSVTLNNDDVLHMASRHTWEFFAMIPSNAAVKAENSMWPLGTTRADVLAMATDAINSQEIVTLCRWLNPGETGVIRVQINGLLHEAMINLSGPNGLVSLYPLAGGAGVADVSKNLMKAAISLWKSL
jgi:hypothetical protein